MASTRNILLIFELYQKAKLNFLQGIYDYTLKKEVNFQQLLDLNIMTQVIPLLTDGASNVQNLAIVTTVKLSAGCQAIAEYILQRNVLSCLGNEFEQQPKDYRRNVLQIVKHISKYSALTEELLNQGKHLLTSSIDELDNVQRELVLSTLTQIANHSICNAHQVMNLHVLHHVISCLQVPINLSLEATQLVKALSKHSEDIARSLVEHNILSYLGENLNSDDPKIIKQTFLCFSEISKHSIEFAEKVMSTSALCKAIFHTSHSDNNVRRSAAVLLRELCKHSVDISRSVVQHGALAGLFSLIDDTNSMVKLPAAKTLGHMGSQSEHLALHIIHSQGLPVLIKALNNESNETCLSSIVWALESLTKHSVQHVHYLNDSNVFAKLLRIYISSESSPDLKCRCLSFLRSTIDKCFNIQDIELLLYESPPEILLPALKQLCKILAQDVKARRVFVSTNGLKRVQALKPPAGSELSEAVTIINSYFPEDIVRYFSPRNSTGVSEKV
ncbi:hypothetical protein WDU94_015107, partial [Cyamophila willieti]